jgi:hypothetical protein
MPFVENHLEFTARMGCPFVKLKDGTLLFENGAQSDGDFNRQGPPVDPSMRLTLQRQYWTIRVQRAEKAFHSLKARLSGGTDAMGAPIDFQWEESELGPIPPEQHDEFGFLVGTASLRRLQEIVMERRATLEKVEKQLADLPENRQRCEMQEFNRRLDAETASRQYARMNEVNSITI